MFDTATPYTASYVIVRKNNKIAFVLRSNTKWMDNYYGLPSGKVEKNESFTEAAIREAKEEIGITVALSELRFLHVTHRQEELEWVDVYFKAESWAGEPKNAEPHLHSDLAWLDPDNLPENVIPSVVAVLEHIRNGEFYSEYPLK
jgi:8-oxo-dGTP diphosphatase